MYRTIQDFLEDWKRERISTIQIFRGLTDQSLDQRVTQDGRSLGFLAWHIITSLGEMGRQAGLDFQAPSKDSPQPSSSTEIVQVYELVSSSIASQVEKKWTDHSLLEGIEIFGQTWTRGATLRALCTHQTHHRAQMTVLMRQAGLHVHGVYGPSREEWSRMGRKAPA